jgi:hypothetical protein
MAASVSFRVVTDLFTDLAEESTLLAVDGVGADSALENCRTDGGACVGRGAVRSTAHTPGQT